MSRTILCSLVGPNLTVKVIIIVLGKVASLASLRGSAASCTVGEAEVVAEATCLLQGLAEHLVLLDIIVRHGPVGERFED